MKSLFLVLGMNSVQFIQLYMFQNRIEQINFLELKITIFSVRSWSRLEPPFFVRSRSRLQDLGLPEPATKVAAPQHCCWPWAYLQPF